MAKCRVDECEKEAVFDLIIRKLHEYTEQYCTEFCREHYQKIQITFD